MPRCGEDDREVQVPLAITDDGGTDVELEYAHVRKSQRLLR